ncbi:MAG TPA: CPBP family intramembrane glutamic endopeptidase [Gemmatimonadales bacterium]|nr:CPBP family intramembrane glutamic endopeptidase [Gemmatimonadales bacterium]
MTAAPAGAREILKAIGWSIAFLLIGLAVTTALFSLAALAYGQGDLQAGTRVLERPGGAQTLAGGVSQLLGFGLATWIVGFKFLHLDRAALRWERPARGVRGMLGGLALGAGAASLALVAAVVAGSAYWSRDSGGLGDYALQVTKTTLALVPAALSEEVMFRGVPLVLVAAVTSRPTSLLVVSALTFSAFHWLNPDVTPLALGNIALAGLFLGVAFYAPGGLWTAFGAHLGWNATLAALDAPVSGLPYRIPLLDYHAGEPAWLSGGRFGPEGGVVSTAALALVIAVTVRWARKESA